MMGSLFTLVSFVLGLVAFALGFRAGRRSKALPEADRRCPAIKTVTYADIRGSETVRCEYDRFHLGPHGTRLSRSAHRHYWQNEEEQALDRELSTGKEKPWTSNA